MNTIISIQMSEFKLTTTSFENEGMIPKRYTPHGEDYNPQLSWTGAPPGTKSFALINNDPDAPVGLWTHWLVKNIPANTTSIKENSVPGVEVTNSWGIKKYKGPKPPSGTHRYYFKLYACNVEKMKANTLEQFYKEIEKVKIGEPAVIMGKYTH